MIASEASLHRNHERPYHPGNAVFARDSDCERGTLFLVLNYTKHSISGAEFIIFYGLTYTGYVILQLIASQKESSVALIGSGVGEELTHV